MENMNDWIISETGEVRRSDVRSHIDPYFSSVVLSRVTKEFLESDNGHVAIGGVMAIDKIAQKAEVEFELNDGPVFVNLQDLIVVTFEDSL